MSEYTGSYDVPPISDQSVTLGDFVFNGWEVPEKVSWGGTQQMTVHKFVGGTRYIDVMGEDNQDISWTGRFLSPDASFRADLLDQMRKSGSPFELVFAGRYYIVVIQNFVADQVMEYHVPYRICLTPVSDNSFVLPPPLTPLSAASYDVNAANDLDVIMPPPILPIGVDPVAAAVMAPLLPAELAIAALPALLLPVTALAAGTAATTALVAAVGSAAGLVQVAQAAADTQIAAVAATEQTVANVAGATTVVNAVSNMQKALAASYTSAAAVAMSGYMGRISKNIDVTPRQIPTGNIVAAPSGAVSSPAASPTPAAPGFDMSNPNNSSFIPIL